MGCGSSRKALVGPGEDQQHVAWNDKQRVRDSKAQDDNRGTSAASAHSAITVDSGLGCDDRRHPGEVPGWPLGRSTAANGPRADATDILEELRAQGLIQSTPRVVRGGQAFDVMVTDSPSGRPPARLERLVLRAGSARGAAARSTSDDGGAAAAAVAEAAARREEVMRERRERQLQREERAQRVRESKTVAMQIQKQQQREGRSMRDDA